MSREVRIFGMLACSLLKGTGDCAMGLLMCLCSGVR